MLLETIDSFKGKYRWLSNFHVAPVFGMLPDGSLMKVPSTEHAYQMRRFRDYPDVAMEVATASTPAMAKRLSKEYKLLTVIGWDDIKQTVMYSALYQKFHRTLHPDLCQKLVDTDPYILVEGNTWGDTYWGVCDGVGENHLGRMLMEIRNLLKRDFKYTSK